MKKRWFVSAVVLLAAVGLWTAVRAQAPSPQRDPAAKQMDAIQKRLDALEQRIAAAGQLPLPSLETRLDRIETRLLRLEERSIHSPSNDSLLSVTTRLEGRIQSLEQQVSRLQK